MVVLARCSRLVWRLVLDRPRACSQVEVEEEDLGHEWNEHDELDEDDEDGEDDEDEEEEGEGGDGESEVRGARREPCTT